jgi:glutathione S-transferase
MLAVYHDNLSVCAQKVRMALDEKGLAWESRYVNLMKQEHLTPEYLRLNPRGLVPVLLHDDNIIYESTIILEYIEDAFSDRPLRPADAAGRAKMRLWTKIPDDGLHVACASVTYASAFVHQLKQHHSPKELAQRLAKLPDKARAARQQQILDLGFEAPFVKDAVLLHNKVLTEMESALAHSTWLNAEFSLADIAIIPYVTRLDRLGLEAMWAQRPNVKRWFNAMQARPSFATAITAFGSTAYDDELKKRGIDVWPQVKKLLAA